MNSCERTDVYLGYRVFHLSWLVFLVLHWLVSVPAWSTVGNGFLQSGFPFMRWVSFAYGPVAVVSLVFPHRRWLFVTALALVVVAKIDALPFVSNHIFGALLIHFALLTTFLLSANVRDERAGVSQAYSLFAQPLRIILVLVYFFPVLHKLNADYLNTDVSCGTSLYREMAALVPLFPDATWAHHSAIFGTLVVETAIPALLLTSTLRGWGVVLGVLFHFVLALHPDKYILSFSAEVWALYTLFLPAAWIHRFGNAIADYSSRTDVRRPVLAILALGVAAAAVYLVAATDPNERIWEPMRRLEGIARQGWYLWSLAVFVVVGVTMWRGPWGGPVVDATRSTKPALRWSLAPFPVLVALNGFSPYLGLKTATNFSMFSNLRVVGAENNHLFMPSGLLPIDHQIDLVEIRASTVPNLHDRRRDGNRVPYFELRRILGYLREEGVAVEFRRGNEFVKVAWPEDRDHEVFEPPPLLEQKLLVFRDVPPRPCPCQW